MALKKEKTPRAAPTLPLLLVPQITENGRKWQLQGRKRLFVPHFCIRLGPLRSLPGRFFTQIALIFWVLSDLFVFFCLFYRLSPVLMSFSPPKEPYSLTWGALAFYETSLFACATHLRPLKPIESICLRVSPRRFPLVVGRKHVILAIVMHFFAWQRVICTRFDFLRLFLLSFCLFCPLLRTFVPLFLFFWLKIGEKREKIAKRR